MGGILSELTLSEKGAASRRMDIRTETAKDDTLWYDFEGRIILGRVTTRLNVMGATIERVTHFVDVIDQKYVPVYAAGGMEVGGEGYRLHDQRGWILEATYDGYNWNKGSLTRAKTNHFKGDKVTKEEFGPEGLPETETETFEFFDDSGRKVGHADRVVSYIYDGSTLNAPLIADRGQTTVSGESYGVPFGFEFTESKAVDFKVDINTNTGILTLELTDLLRDLTWYESKDLYRRNRDIESREYFHTKDGVFTRSQRQHYNGTIVKETGLRLGFYDIADTSHVAVISPYGYEELFKTSKALDYSLRTGELTTQITNRKLGNLVWRETKDKFNRLTTTMTGVVENGIFDPTTSTELNYEGIPVINVAAQFCTHLAGGWHQLSLPD